jgi:hypothetical protein
VSLRDLLKDESGTTPGKKKRKKKKGSAGVWNKQIGTLLPEGAPTKDNRPGGQVGDAKKYN